MALIQKGLSVILVLCFVMLTASAVYGQTDAEAKNAAVMKGFYDEVVNKGKMDMFDSFFADNFAEHEMLPPDLPRNKEGVKQLFTMLRQAFPDLKFTVNDMVSSGDKVWTYITISGTQNGPFMDMPASGKKISIQGFDIVRFANGKAVEHWGLTDDMTMMTQLGAIPPPEEKKK